MQLVHKWEEINEESVKVPSEIYQDLCREGFRVHYWRVPVTDGTTPEVRAASCPDLPSPHGAEHGEL